MEPTIVGSSHYCVDLLSRLLQLDLNVLEDTIGVKNHRLDYLSQSTHLLNHFLLFITHLQSKKTIILLVY